jgi:hypothetical protein
MDEPECIMVSQKSQAHRPAVHDFTYIYNLKMLLFIEAENRMMITRG